MRGWLKASVLALAAFAMPLFAGLALSLLGGPARFGEELSLTSRVGVAVVSWSVRLAPFLLLMAFLMGPLLRLWQRLVRVGGARKSSRSAGLLGRVVSLLVSLGLAAVLLSGLDRHEWLPLAGVVLASALYLGVWVATSRLVDRWAISDELGTAATFAAAMAALSYFGAGAYTVGTTFGWWRGNLVETAFLTGLAGLSLLWLIEPLTTQAGLATNRLGSVAAALAFLAALLSGAACLGLGATVLSDIQFRTEEVLWFGSAAPPELLQSPYYWLATLGLLGPWLGLVNLRAWQARTWPRVVCALGLAAGVVALLVPLTLLDIAFGEELTLLVGVAGGLVLPAWLLLLSFRSGQLREAARLAVFTVVPAVVLIAGLNLWARARFTGIEKAWEADLAVERARVAALSMPVLRGEPRRCNAVKAYVPLLSQLYPSLYPDGGAALGNPDPEFQRAHADLARAAAAGPYAALPASVATLLESRRPLAAALREATRCERVDFAYRYEHGLETPFPSLLAARWLSQLVIVEGHERAQAGDLAGAAQRYLDVERFGADLESQGLLITSLIGLSVRRDGLRALGGLVTQAPPGELPADLVSTEFERLAARPSAVAAGYRGERLVLVPGLRAPLSRAYPLLDLVVGRPLGGLALAELLPLLREAEAAAGADDPVRAAALLEPAFAASARSRNPITSARLPPPGRAALSFAETRAHRALARAALAAEAARHREGGYPAALTDLPGDPFALPAPVRYRVEGEGAGYTVWSVGWNGRDDGGDGGPEGADLPRDIVLNRAASVNETESVQGEGGRR